MHSFPHSDFVASFWVSLSLTSPPLPYSSLPPYRYPLQCSAIFTGVGGPSLCRRPRRFAAVGIRRGAAGSARQLLELTLCPITDSIGIATSFGISATVLFSQFQPFSTLDSNNRPKGPSFARLARPSSQRWSCPL